MPLTLVACVMVACAAAAISGDARAAGVNLDRDPGLERLVQVRAAAGRVPGHQWAVVDRRGARRVVTRIGPIAERLLAPRFADHNRDGIRDLQLTGLMGATVVQEVWQYDGRRARALWRVRIADIEQFIPRGLLLSGFRIGWRANPGVGADDLVLDVAAGSCRACPGRRFTVTYVWSQDERRWVLLGD